MSCPHSLRFATCSRHPRVTIASPVAVLVVLGCLAWVGSTARAQPGVEAPAAARLFVETLAVEGNRRVSEEILISQTLLEPGREYHEGELRDALHRVRRLPFVLDAELRLDRGSEPGRYRLVFVVSETSSFFYAADFAIERRDSEFEFDGQTLETSDRELEAYDGTLGGRWFVGNRGIVFAAIDEGLAAGYTHYDLFGTRAFVTAGARLGLCCNRSRSLRDTLRTVDETVELSLGVGWPLRGNHAFQLEIRQATSEQSEELSGSSADVSADALGVEGRWVFDRTDDPILPSRGRRHALGLAVTRLDHAELVRLGPASLAVVPLDSTLQEVFAETTWYLPYGRSHSFGVGLTAGVAHHSTDASGDARDLGELFERSADGVRGSFELSHAWLLRERRRLGRYSGLRWENRLIFSFREQDGERPSIALAFESDQHQLELRTGLAYRNRFGVVRLGLSWIEGRSR